MEFIADYFGYGCPDPAEFYGRRILSAWFNPSYNGGYVGLSLDGGVNIKFFDNGQDCCEHRYMTCDDDLSKLCGGLLRRIEVRTVRQESTECGDSHEMAFVEIGTDECFITLCTHNEHNGCYGGFSLMIERA